MELLIIKHIFYNYSNINFDTKIKLKHFQFPEKNTE